MRHLPNTLCALTAVLICQAGLAEPPLHSGVADCDRSGHGRACMLGWNFSEDPHPHYRVQRLTTRPQQWVNTEVMSGDPYATGDSVEGGYLYRVAACDDRASTKNCSYSTVQWAIERPTQEEIPDYLLDGDGVKMEISKSDDLLSQTDQYNVYRLIQLLDDVDDVHSLPPMTEPRVSNVDTPTLDDSVTDDDMIFASIYHNYEMRRKAGRSRKGKKNHRKK
jgi:hypothetical protein